MQGAGGGTPRGGGEAAGGGRWRPADARVGLGETSRNGAVTAQSVGAAPRRCPRAAVRRGRSAALPGGSVRGSAERRGELCRQTRILKRVPFPRREGTRNPCCG